MEDLVDDELEHAGAQGSGHEVAHPLHAFERANRLQEAQGAKTGRRWAQGAR